MHTPTRFIFTMILFMTMGFTLTVPLTAKEDNPLDYYRLHFEPTPKHPLADTLFEKTVWHKKVSHVVIEEKKDRYQVTLLMISPYPHNYKSQNYALYYEFSSFKEAFTKFTWLNRFLRSNGVMRITILGSKITSEKILYEGDEQEDEKFAAEKRN